MFQEFHIETFRGILADRLILSGNGRVAFPISFFLGSFGVEKHTRRRRRPPMQRVNHHSTLIIYPFILKLFSYKGKYHILKICHS